MFSYLLFVDIAMPSSNTVCANSCVLYCRVLLPPCGQVKLNNLSEEFWLGLAIGGSSTERSVDVVATLQVTPFLANGQRSERLDGQSFKCVHVPYWARDVDKSRAAPLSLLVPPPLP